jgi:VWFA-related protein
MKRFFILLSLLLVASAALFAQSRPQRPVNNSGQKANQRPTQTADTPEKTENRTSADQNAADESPVDAGIDDGEVLRVDTRLVTIPVKISDRKNRFIAGLQKEDFKIFEDGREQEIAYFSDAEEPFTVALVLDMSYSSTFKINEIQAAALAFIAQLHQDDKVMVVSFDEEVHLLCEPTNDRKVLQAAIRSTKIASGTSLFEAVDLVVNKRFKKISGRKAIVLFTDGVDTTSRRASDLSNLKDVYELDALIYPIEYDTYYDVQAMKNRPATVKAPSPIPPTIGNTTTLPFPIPTVGTPSSQGTSAEDYRKAREYLQELADRTSGRVYKAGTTANLAQAFTNIASELRQIYSLGFYPADEKEGKRRQLKVRVNREGAVVRARDSYVVNRKK